MSDQPVDHSVLDPIPVETVPPLVQTYTVDGDYAAATISRAGDPEGANTDARVRTRLVVASEDEVLRTSVVSCLIGEFGLTQEEAEAIEAVPMSGGARRAAPKRDTKREEAEDKAKREREHEELAKRKAEEQDEKSRHEAMARRAAEAKPTTMPPQDNKAQHDTKHDTKNATTKR